jgi:hypothetical protein
MRNENMRKLILTFAALIGIYTLFRNNVYQLPGQLVWSTNPDLFYKVLIPLLLVSSSLVALFYKGKLNYFILTFTTVAVDAINRLSVAINHLYQSVLYDSQPTIEIPTDATLVVFNHWPSHVMGIIEIMLLVMAYNYFKKQHIKTHNKALQWIC